MKPRRRAVAGALMAIALVLLPACGRDATDPTGASDCRELVERASSTAKKVLKSIEGQTKADLEGANPTDPFQPLTEPFERFKLRAAELGCDEGELRRLACVAYRDLKPTGPAAEEYLARVVSTCS